MRWWDGEVVRWWDIMRFKLKVVWDELLWENPVFLQAEQFEMDRHLTLAFPLPTPPHPLLFLTPLCLALTLRLELPRALSPYCRGTLSACCWRSTESGERREEELGEKGRGRGRGRGRG